MSGFPHIEEFTPQREDTIAVATYDPQPCHRQGFGRISLGQNQRTVEGVSGPSIVGVIKFGDAFDLVSFCSGMLLVELSLGLEPHPALDGFYNSTFHRLHKEITALPSDYNFIQLNYGVQNA